MRTSLSKDTKAVLRVLRTELRAIGADVHRIANAIVELEYAYAEKVGADNIGKAE